MPSARGVHHQLRSTHGGPSYSLLLPGSSWGRTEKLLALVALAAIALLAALSWGFDAAEALMSWSLYSPSRDGSFLADLTFVDRALEHGAVCLDGSPPGYYFQPGYGTGARRWLIHLEGGGWCTTLEECAERAKTRLGSTHFRPKQERLKGILSNSSDWNPDFYNWNRVFVAYCDGASFAGDVDKPLEYKGQKLYFRGLRIFNTLMLELRDSGMMDATHALLTGCSAGALSAIIHCDRFRNLFDDPPTATIAKCMADGGFFLDTKDVDGKFSVRELFRRAFELQELHTAVPESCLESWSSDDAWECMFPQNLIRHTHARVFVTNALYDTWQMENVFVPRSADSWGRWSFCKKDPIRCSAAQLDVLNEYRRQMVDHTQLLEEPEEGLFLNACFIHCQTPFATSWHGPEAPRISNLTIAEAVGDWFYGRATRHLVDGVYPSNPTCYDWQHKR